MSDEKHKRVGVLASIQSESDAARIIEEGVAARQLANCYSRFYRDFAHDYDHAGGHTEAFVAAARSFQTFDDSPHIHPSSLLVKEQLDEIVKLMEAALDPRAGPDQAFRLVESVLGFIYHSTRVTAPGLEHKGKERQRCKSVIGGSEGGRKRPARPWQAIAEHLLEESPNKSKRTIWLSIADGAPYNEIETWEGDVEYFRDGERLFATVDGGKQSSLARKTFEDRYLRTSHPK